MGSRQEKRAQLRAELDFELKLKLSQKRLSEELHWIPDEFERRLFDEKDVHDYVFLYCYYRMLWEENARKWNASSKIQADVKWFGEYFAPQEAA